MKIIIIAGLLLLCGCIPPMAGYNYVYGPFGQPTVAQELAAQHIYWTNQRYQQDQLFLMQQQNAIMQQQGMCR